MTTKTDGKTFRVGNVQTAADIPTQIWHQMFPAVKEAFPFVKLVGDIPLPGGNVSVNAPPVRDKWDPNFCAILRRFDGTPLTAAAS